LPADIAADVVIRIRPEAYQAPFASLATDIDRVITQLLRWRIGEPEPGSTSPDCGSVESDT
jgi:hypothetical protein